MEPTVLSGPLGHAQWESEQPFPLGFQTTNNGGVLCSNQSGQAGLDDEGDTFTKSQEEDLFAHKPFELDNFIKISSFSCGDLHFDGQSVVSHPSVHLQELSCEKNQGLDGISDCTLSWLFSSNFPDVSEKTTASKEVTFTQESSPEGSNVLGGQADPMNLSVPSSPVSIKDPETNAGDQFLLVDLSDELSCLARESTSELNLQGVTEEQAGLPPLQTLLPETGDKGLFPDQVTDLPITCSTTVQGLPESCQPPSHISTPQEHLEGFVPLLDLDVPDFDSNFCPASPASDVCSGTQLEVANAGAALTGHLLEEKSENESLALSLPDKPSPLTLPLTQDARCHDDLTSERNSVENIPEDLMENSSRVKARNQENGDMALDLCLTVEEVHDDDESWNLKLHEDLKTGSALSPRAEQREVARLTDTNQLEDSDHHEEAPFDFSVQDIDVSSPETGWTIEQAVETISPSKMVGDDSLPMVSAVNTRDEDVSPLKAVFDALDQDGDGFVRVEEFMEFAAAYGADQVRRLVIVFFSPRRASLVGITC